MFRFACFVLAALLTAVPVATEAQPTTGVTTESQPESQQSRPDESGFRIGIYGGLFMTMVENFETDSNTGAGVYFEVAPDFGGLSTLLKIDLVSINGRQGGGLSAMFGYVF